MNETHKELRFQLVRYATSNKYNKLCVLGNSKCYGKQNGRTVRLGAGHEMFVILSGMVLVGSTEKETFEQTWR